MRRPLALLLVTAALSAACSGDDVEDERAEQIRAIAEDAGLADEVVDVLVLASGGATATFQVTYPGEDGTELVVSQAPGQHRIDVVSAGRIVHSDVVRNDTAYSCDPPDDDPAGALDCVRTSGNAGGQVGVFDDEALERFAEDLAAGQGETTITVDEQELAGVDARCIRSRPKEGPTDGTGPTSEALCFSPEGAPLLVDAGTDRLAASAYTTDVPDGTFDV